MEEKFRERKLKINKEYRNVLLTSLLSLFFLIGVLSVGIDNIMLVTEVMLSVLRVSEVSQLLLLKGSELVITYLPFITTVLCNRKMLKLNKESKQLQDEYIEYWCNKAFLENKAKIDDLLEESKGLSRRELINFLNMTKTEIVKAEQKNKFKCESVDLLMLNYLQTGLEDILFPSIIEEDKGRTRTRKK